MRANPLSPRLTAVVLHVALAVASLCHVQAEPGHVTVAGVFGDHAVVQRGVEVPVWGKATPGAEVTVEFAGQKKSARADAVGK